MSDTIGDGRIEVELLDGAWIARWPEAGVTAGPFTARVRLGETHRSEGPGRWDVTDGGGSSTRAIWRPDDPESVTVELELGVEPGIVVARASARVAAATTLRGVDALHGPVTTPFDRRLVNGYDSWSWSGVVAHGRGDSWWNTTLVADGCALAIQALTARRFCTRVHFEDADVTVACEGAPDAQPVDGTWGFLTVPRDTAVVVTAGDVVVSEPIALGAGRDAFAVTEQLATVAAGADMGNARHWDGPPVAGWESWYHYGLFVRADEILANARSLRERYADVLGFDLVQIDDGWQVTYGAWWPNERFPGDLAAFVRELRGVGCRVGLWLAPFMVQPEAPGVATDHPEWLVRAPAGRPVLDRHGRYALDASNPDARAWLRELGTQVRAWGVDMVKIDFLYLGAVVGQRHDPAMTGTQALRLGLDAFVEGLGREIYVLGCGLPLLPAVGICHGNRVGHDLAVPVQLRGFGQPLADGWTGFAGIRAQARNVSARWALHRRWFEADPDVVMAWGGDRRTPEGYSTEESRTLATLAALCGGPFLLADDLGALDDTARGVLEHRGLLALALGHGDGFRPVDLFAGADAPRVGHVFEQPTALASTWTAVRDGRRVVARFNWTETDTSCPPPDDLGPAHELWTGDAVGTAPLVVPANGVRVFVADEADTPAG